jgi:hypothetical protein
MMILAIILIVIPGILVNRWLTAKERAKKQRGFEVKLTDPVSVAEKKEIDHG